MEIKSNPFFETAIYGVFLFVAGLVLPVILIFIVRFTGYSEIVEEIAKALVVLFLILNFPALKQKIGAGILFGFLFGLSENFFYLNQIFQLGDFSVFWQRFLLDSAHAHYHGFGDGICRFGKKMGFDFWTDWSDNFTRFV